MSGMHIACKVSSNWSMRLKAGQTYKQNIKIIEYCMIHTLYSDAMIGLDGAFVN